MPTHDMGQARHAVVYIGRALALREASRPRNRGFDLIGLSRTHLLIGEPEHAAAVVTEALPLVDRRRPGRLGRRLGDWQREPAPFATMPAVRDARDAVRELASV